MSFPFNPIRMKAGPSHLIKAYVVAKARPLNAREIVSGAPSSRSVCTRTEMQMPETVRRRCPSLVERVVLMVSSADGGVDGDIARHTTTR